MQTFCLLKFRLFLFILICCLCITVAQQCGKECIKCDGKQDQCNAASKCFYLVDSDECVEINTCTAQCSLCTDEKSCKDGAGGFCEFDNVNNICIGTTCNTNCRLCDPKSVDTNTGLNACDASAAPPNGCFVDTRAKLCMSQNIILTTTTTPEPTPNPTLVPTKTPYDWRDRDSSSESMSYSSSDSYDNAMAMENNIYLKYLETKNTKGTMKFVDFLMVIISVTSSFIAICLFVVMCNVCGKRNDEHLRISVKDQEESVIECYNFGESTSFINEL